MDSNNIINMFMIGSILISISILLSPLSSKLGIPILLIVLGIGMLAGNEGLGIKFSNYRLAYLISNLALSIILFDGGLRTSKSDFRIALYPAISLSTIGVAITSSTAGLVASYLFNLNIFEGLLVGAIIGSTDAAAVFSLLTNKNLNKRISSTLEIESGCNDPMAMFLTVSLINIIDKNQTCLNFKIFLLCFVKDFIIGIFLGLIGGWILHKIINNISLSNGLYPLLTISFGLFIFSLTTFLHGSGILAVYLCGFVLGNIPIRNRYGILQVFDGMSWLCQICMFLVLGLLVIPTELTKIFFPALLLSLCLMFISRPLSIFIGLIPFSNYTIRERFFLSWVGLRGAVPIILSVFPIMAGINNSRLYFNIAFFVVLTSLIIQGMSFNLASRISKVILPQLPLPISKIGLDIHPENTWEQFIYQIKDENWCIDVFLRELNMPSDTRISALFRDNILIDINHNTKLITGDILCIIAREKDLPILGNFFSNSPVVELNNKFFGDFILNAKTKLNNISNIYGLNFNNTLNKNITIGDFIISSLGGGEPVLGDHIIKKGVIWIIAGKKGSKVIKIGITIDR